MELKCKFKAKKEQCEIFNYHIRSNIYIYNIYLYTHIHIYFDNGYQTTYIFILLWIHLEE